MNTAGMDKRTRRTLFAAATLLAPAIAVQAIRLTLGWKPATVAAAPAAPVEPPAPAPVTKPLSKEQVRLVEYLAQNDGAITRAALSSPMDSTPAPIAPAIEPDRPVMVTKSDVPTRPAAELRLGGIMGAGNDALAMVNGKVRRIGDEIEPGWRVSAIDPQAFAVTLSGPEGVEYLLKRE